MQFYRRFLESPNFSSWLERRRQAAFAAEAHQRALAAGSLSATLASLDDVQLIERFAALEVALEQASGQPPAQQSQVGPQSTTTPPRLLYARPSTCARVKGHEC